MDTVNLAHTLVAKLGKEKAFDLVDKFMVGGGLTVFEDTFLCNTLQAIQLIGEDVDVHKMKNNLTKSLKIAAGIADANTD